MQRYFKQVAHPHGKRASALSAILGRIEFDHRRIDKPAFATALDRLVDYGQDAQSSEITPSIAVGCCAAQHTPAPLKNRFDHAEDRLLVVADAILDNREELGRLLSVPEKHLKTLSDTDLIRISYRRWGSSCIDHIDGDYAFACIDLTHRKLFMARDHIGSRPLYWARRNNTFLFATAIEALLEFRDFDWTIDQRMIAEYLVLPVYPVTKPFFSEIHSVGAGCFHEVTHNSHRKHRWWAPATKPRYKPKRRDDAIAECRFLLEQAIDVRTRSRRAVGTHLSGGIDSSAVTVIAQDQLKTKGKTLKAAYAWAPPIDEHYPILDQADERLLIQQIAASADVPVRFGTANAENLISFLDREMELETQTNLPDELPVLKQAKRDGIGIMLSGLGGDEAFSSHGYGYFGHLFWRGHFSSALNHARHKCKTLRSLKTLREIAWKELIHPLLPDSLYFKFKSLDAFSQDFSCISNTLSSAYPGIYANRIRDAKFGFNPNENLLHHMRIGHLNMRMEGWATWSAPFGFQYRYPLTDRKLLEFCLKLDPELLFLNDEPRGLSRAVLGDRVPVQQGKFDIMNERYRTDAKIKAVGAIAHMVRTGHFSDNCPWIDKSKFVARATRSKSAESSIVAIENMSVFASVRAWGTYRRAKKNGWI